MIRAHKLGLNPTSEQEVYFRKAWGTARFVFKGALARWQPHQAEAPDTPFGPLALQKAFNAIQGEQSPWVYEVTKSVGQSAFANFGNALQNYDDSQGGQRQGRQMDFPQFKSKRSRKKSFGLANDRFLGEGNSLKLQKLRSLINRAEPRRFNGQIMGAVVSYQASHWYIAIQVEMQPRHVGPLQA